MRNFNVIGGAYFKLEYSKCWSNFEFDRSTVSGTRPCTSHAFMIYCVIRRSKRCLGHPFRNRSQHNRHTESLHSIVTHFIHPLYVFISVPCMCLGWFRCLPSFLHRRSDRGPVLCMCCVCHYVSVCPCQLTAKECFLQFGLHVYFDISLTTIDLEFIYELSLLLMLI